MLKVLMDVWMDKIRHHLDKISKDEEGATLLEYTVLLVIILGGAITFIIAAGGWVSGKWSSLMATLGNT